MGWRIRGQPELHNEFRASLSYETVSKEKMLQKRTGLSDGLFHSKVTVRNKKHVVHLEKLGRTVTSVTVKK